MNRDILIRASEVLQEFNVDQNEHEAFILLANTISETATPPNTHDTLIVNAGGLMDISFAFCQLLRNQPKLALPAMHYALLKVAEENNLPFLKPLLQAVFEPLGLSFPEPKKNSAIIRPFGGSIKGREN